MKNKLCIQCFVSGKVQGVWFRASTQEKANALGVTGWARNLADGRVEVLACGDEDKVMELYEWLKKGPPLAKVTDATFATVDWQEIAFFETR